MGFKMILLESYVWFILFVGFYFGKMWKIWEKRLFFRVDIAGLGKYHTGGYGRIGVYRVRSLCPALTMYLILELTMKPSSIIVLLRGRNSVMMYARLRKVCAGAQGLFLVLNTETFVKVLILPSEGCHHRSLLDLSLDL